MKRAGFTLIEMVLTIVVGGILLLGITGFVELGMRGYSDSINRQRVQTEAKFVIEKISREIRHAVPNMLENTSGTQCLNFYPIQTSGFYAVSGADLQFVVASNTLTVADLTNLNLVINPTQFNPTNNNFSLSGATSLNNVFTLPSEAANIVGNSVANRHYIYDPNGMVSYCFNNNILERSVNQNNPIPISDTGVGGTLVYNPALVQNGGLVNINLTFTNQDGSETTNFQHNVQVTNVP